MVINIDGNDLRHGILGLVIALVELITDALKLQAVKRLEGGDLTEMEMERLGEALMDLDRAMEEIKREQGLSQTVKSVRDGLDGIADEILAAFTRPEEGLEGGEQLREVSHVL